jgi:hypothetical protein
MFVPATGGQQPHSTGRLCAFTVGVEPPPENCGDWLIIRQNESKGISLDIKISFRFWYTM